MLLTMALIALCGAVLVAFAVVVAPTIISGWFGAKQDDANADELLSE